MSTSDMKFRALIIGIVIACILLAGYICTLRERGTGSDSPDDRVKVEIRDLNETIVAVKEDSLLKRLQGHWKLAPRSLPPRRIPLELSIGRSTLKRVRNPDTALYPEHDSLYYGLYHDTDLGTYRIRTIPDNWIPVIDGNAFDEIDELRFPEDPNSLEVRCYDLGRNKMSEWYVYRRQ